MSPDPSSVPTVGECPSSIVALHGGALGDYVLTHHLLAGLRRLSGVSRIDVVARSPLARWSVGRGAIERAPEYETFRLQQLFGDAEPGARSVVDELGKYRLVLSFLGDGGSTPAGALSRAGLAAVNIDPNPNGSTDHIVSQWWSQLADQVAWCADVTLDIPGLSIGGDERRSARGKLSAVTGRDGGPYVIVHPGAGSRTKCCPVEILGPVAERLAERGCGVVWMVGPTELDWYGADWVAGLERIAPVLAEESAAAAADVVLGADLYVGGDAGMTHVAAATGVDTVALFGPTDSRVWAPRGRSVSVIDCGPAFESVRAEVLWHALLSRLDEAS